MHGWWVRNSLKTSPLDFERDMKRLSQLALFLFTALEAMHAVRKAVVMKTKNTFPK